MIMAIRTIILIRIRMTTWGMSNGRDHGERCGMT
jgi:hypothetical protein